MFKSISSKIKNRVLLLYFLLFTFFVFVAFNIPLTGDDWTWGSSIGVERLDNFFKDYNGRYVSNVLELMLTRNTVFRVLFIALFSSLLIILTGKLFNTKRKSVPLLSSFILFMLIPINIYAQTFGWVAGYVNYVVSIVLLFIFLVLVNNIFGAEAPTYKKRLFFLFIPLGFATQLIVEHVTLFALFTVFSVILYTYIKHKKVYATHVSYLISSIIGALVMFSNGAYVKVLQGEDSYRTIKEHVSLGERIYNAYTENMYAYLFTDNVLIHLVISILLIMLIQTSDSNKRVVRVLVKPIIVFIITSFALFLLVFQSVLGNSYLGSFTNDFEAIFSLIYFIAILMAFFLIPEWNTKIRLLYYSSGIVLLSVPFFFITPYGPRCAFGTYAFMVLLAIELMSYLINKDQWKFSYLNLYLVLISCSIVVFIGFVSFMNGEADRNRMEKLFNDIHKEKVVEMTELPYPQFHWMPSPKPEMIHTPMFKKFHDISNDVQIKIIPYFQSQR